MSIVFYPQTNGLTKRINQEIKVYLKTFCNYNQDDWVLLLPIGEFTYNNSFTLTTKILPFYANYGHHPATSNLLTPADPKAAASDFYNNWILVIQEQARRSLEEVRARQKKYANKYRREALKFKAKDLIILNT